MMRFAVYENSKLYSLTDPFYIDEQTNELHIYSGKGNPIDIRSPDNVEYTATKTVCGYGGGSCLPASGC